MSNLAISLIITVVGMGLVFIAILLLWALMEIIVKMTAEKPAEGEQESVGASPAPGGLKQRVAAAAVAVALSMRRGVGRASSLTMGDSNIPSVWLAAGRMAALERPASAKSKKG